MFEVAAKPQPETLSTQLKKATKMLVKAQEKNTATNVFSSKRNFPELVSNSQGRRRLQAQAINSKPRTQDPLGSSSPVFLFPAFILAVLSLVGLE